MGNFHRVLQEISAYNFKHDADQNSGPNGFNNLCQGIATLLSASPEERLWLYRRADEIRACNRGNDIHIRGIIEFSNHCSRHCQYCGLRAENKNLPRYRMTLPEILEAAREGADLGVKTTVLQSGEDAWYSREMLCEIISAIKKELAVAVTLSVGIRSAGDYQAFRQAGADRYLIKHEIADPELFGSLRPGTILKERLDCQNTLKKLGYALGSGFIVGLPGQTKLTVARDILLLRQQQVEMAGIGPFIPAGNTPLAGEKGGALDDTLTALAVTRLILPRANLPATTAIGTLHPKGRALALKCGANVLMPNITPVKYRPLYRIYPGKLGTDIDPRTAVREVLDLIKVLGREVGQGYGD